MEKLHIAPLGKKDIKKPDRFLYPAYNMKN
jgi:hypothetical protein